MRIDPALRALRSDPASQRSAQAALEKARDAWKAHGEVASVLEELGEFGSGADLGHCPALLRLVEQPRHARSVVEELIARMQEELGAHPLGQIPFRHQYVGGIAVLQLAEAGRAALSLVTYEEQDGSLLAEAQTVCFSDGERQEVYLAGAGAADLFEISQDEGERVSLKCTARELGEGSTLSLVGARQTKLVRRIDGRLVMLRLSRTAENPEPAREFRIDDGRLVHRASGDRRESRQEMAMALLGRMGRSDAAPVLETIAFDGSDHLRWQAVRECLALDTARGFVTLSRIAHDANDNLSPTAGTYRAQLLEAHPQLASLETTLCPA